MNFNEKSAIKFLSDRNPLDIQQTEYVCRLIDFAETHGEKALVSLAGLYLYAITEKKGEASTHMIASVFAHDLNMPKNKHVLPRSQGYDIFFNEEYYYMKHGND